MSPGSSILRREGPSQDVRRHMLAAIVAQLDPFCKSIKTAISCDVFFDFFEDVRSHLLGFKDATDHNNIS